MVAAVNTAAGMWYSVQGRYAYLCKVGITIRVFIVLPDQLHCIKWNKIPLPTCKLYIYVEVCGRDILLCCLTIEVTRYICGKMFSDCTTDDFWIINRYLFRVLELQWYSLRGYLDLFIQCCVESLLVTWPPFREWPCGSISSWWGLLLQNSEKVWIYKSMNMMY